jgi:hypothetical protein
MMKEIIAALILISAAGTAVADTNRNAVVEAQRMGPTKPSKVVSKVRQPVGTPHKASAFAPRPTNKRVFGAPIQAPIVHSPPAPK